MTGVKISTLPAANAANDGDQIEVNQSGISRRVTVAQIAAQVTVLSSDLPEFAVERFGLAVTNPDNLAALLAAMAAVSASGGGTLVFNPGTYAFSNEFYVPNGVSIRGVKGMTKFSFVSANHWTNNSGWIKAAGTYGSPVSLTHDLLRTPRNVMHLSPPASTTRSGTTVTATTDIPHGLVVGDLVWVLGIPGTLAQSVFFTVNWQNTVGAGDPYYGRTTPFVVTGIPTATTFTYTVANTGDTTLTVTYVVVVRAADVAQVANTAGFTVGQTLLLASNAYRQSGSETMRIGEGQKIARILNSTMLYLHSEAQDDYLVSDGAFVKPANLQKGFSVKNIEVIGKGPNLTPGLFYGDRGIFPYLCENPEVEDCIFTDVDQMGIHIWNCIGGRAVGNMITFNASDESGQSSGSLDIQYGVAYSGWTTGLLIQNNTIFGGRHAIVQSGSSGSTEHGICRGITIMGNTCHGQWLSSISSHQAVDTCIVSNNVCTGVQAGVNFRQGRNVTISNNTIVAWDIGIYHYQGFDNLKIHGNNIRASITGIQCATITPPTGNSIATTSDPYGPVTISNNTIIGGDRCLYIYSVPTPISGVRYDINNNVFVGSKYEAMRVTIGDNTVTTDGWVGRISDNSFYDIGITSSNNIGMFLTNMQAGSIDNNVFFDAAGTLTNVIYMDGAGMGDGTVSIRNNKIPADISTGAVLALGVTRQVYSDIVMSDTTLIAGGVAKPRNMTVFVIIDTEGGAATDDLDTLTAVGVVTGRRIILRNVTVGRTVVVKHATGNIRNRGAVDKSLVSIDDKYECIWTGTRWEEI
jgi:hypothetical protein